MPDELDEELKDYKEDNDRTVQGIVMRAIAVAVPVVGSSALEIIDGMAQRRSQERINTVFDEMRNRLHELGRDKIDESFFHSPEFETLVFLLVEKLHTTHDGEKLKLFGAALANSGNIDFGADDKEQFVRILRDMTLGDFMVLNHSNLKGWTPHVKSFDYAPEKLSSPHRLQSMGLVQENVRPSIPMSQTDAQRAFSERVIPAYRTTYSLSGFGDKFLRFVETATRGRRTAAQG